MKAMVFAASNFTLLSYYYVMKVSKIKQRYSNH